MENERCRFQGIALSPETGIPLSCRGYTAASLLPGMIFVRSFNRRRRSVWRLGFACVMHEDEIQRRDHIQRQERSNRSPPTTPMPQLERSSEPSPVPNAIGSMPATDAMLVMTIGRNFDCVARASPYAS
ncbi:MAG: hypothetical protein V8T87_13600 [Victivallales bacterium]